MKLGKYLLVAIPCLLLVVAFYLGRGDQAEQEAAELLRDRQAQPETDRKKPTESTPKKSNRLRVISLSTSNGAAFGTSANAARTSN